MPNLFDEISGPLSQERFETLLRAEGIKLERIVSFGHTTRPGDWLDQETDEWVAVLRGSARLSFEDDVASIVMQPGDYVHIPAHRRHRVEWTDQRQPTVWLALHYPVGTTTARTSRRETGGT
jgi:cupin 2 domain-containing protein